MGVVAEIIFYMHLHINRFIAAAVMMMVDIMVRGTHGWYGGRHMGWHQRQQKGKAWQLAAKLNTGQYSVQSIHVQRNAALTSCSKVEYYTDHLRPGYDEYSLLDLYSGFF